TRWGDDPSFADPYSAALHTGYGSAGLRSEGGVARRERSGVREGVAHQLRYTDALTVTLPKPVVFAACERTVAVCRPTARPVRPGYGPCGGCNGRHRPVATG